MTTACMSRSWKVEVRQKKKLTSRDDQSAISSKEHVKYEATQTYLAITYQHDLLHLAGKRPQQRSQGLQQQQSTPSTRRLHFSKESSRENKSTKQCDTGTNACHHWFLRGYCSMSTYYHLHVAQLNNRRNLYNTTLEAPGTQPLAMMLCGCFWRSNRNHYYLLLV